MDRDLPEAVAELMRRIFPDTASIFPNMRTTHVFGDPASGLMGFHEGTTFAHVLTWAPNGILPNYEALQSSISALSVL